MNATLTMKDDKNRFERLRGWFLFLILMLGFSTTVMAQNSIKLSDEQVNRLVLEGLFHMLVTPQI